MEKKKPQWRSGPPPHPGWWNARVVDLTSDDLPLGLMWGWWDGERWSTFAEPNDSSMKAEARARKTGCGGGHYGHVRWSHYWPENARVPRIDPRSAHA